MSQVDVVVNALRYDRSVKRTWNAGTLSVNGSHIVLIGRFAFDVDHGDLGSISKGTVSVEHFWLDRWSNVFCFYEPDGRFRNYYCNVCLPPIFDGRKLEFVDLDLDVLVWPNGDIVVLDEDELEESRIKFKINPETVRRACDEIIELTRMVEQLQSPFDLHLKNDA